jgi:hypothetical protein
VAKVGLLLLAWEDLRQQLQALRALTMLRGRARLLPSKRHHKLQQLQKSQLTLAPPQQAPTMRRT